jgi:thioredoxin-like negative regulator of GroEL
MAMAQANLFAEHNYSTEAEQAYRVASELSPSYFEPVDQLSKLLLRTGRADEARQLRDNFARNHPDQRPEVDASGTFNVAVPRTQPSRP